jgi:hypothetical protein
MVFATFEPFWRYRCMVWRWTGRFVAMLLVVVLVTVVGAGSAASDSEPSQPAPVVLDLKFRPVVRYASGHCGPPVLTSGRYALVAMSSPSASVCATRYVLIDDQTGKRTVIHESGSLDAQAFGAPWIFGSDGLHDVLYNIVTKKTRRCDASRCQPDGALSYALGSRWLETFVQQPGWCDVGEPDQCGPVTQSFYNIKSGHVDHSSPPNDTTVADLNSRRLFHPVCPPLQVPPGGSLAFYGSFAVATDGAPYGRSSLLERCGTNLQIPIGTSYQVPLFFANPRVVIWQILDLTDAWHGQFAGVLLPSLRPFTATLPAALQNEGAVPVGLTAFRLYVVDATGRLWAARIPGSRRPATGLPA